MSPLAKVVRHRNEALKALTGVSGAPERRCGIQASAKRKTMSPAARHASRRRHVRVGQNEKLLGERSERNRTPFSTFPFTDSSFSPWISR